MRELLLTILHTSGAKIYNLVIVVGTLSLTARWLGPDGRGQLVAITTWVTMFSTIGHLSLGQVAIHRAVNNKSDRWQGEVLGSLLFLAALLSGLCWLVAASSYVVSQGRVFSSLPSWLLLVTFAALPLYIWEQYGSSLLMLKNRIDIYNKCQIYGRTTGLLALILFVLILKLGIDGAIYSIIIGQSIVALGGIRFLYVNSSKYVGISRQETKSLLAGGAKLHWNAIGVIAFGVADILIINHYIGAVEAGYYQLAVQLIGVLLIIPQAVSMIMYGKIAAVGPDEAWVYHKKILLYIIMLLLFGCVLAWILAPWIVTIVAGAKFSPSIAVFRWLMPAVLGMAFSIVMTPQWIGRGFFWQASFVTIAVGIVSVAANFLLVPHYGIKGAAWTAVGACGISAVINIWMVLFCNRKAGHTLMSGI